MPSKVSKKTKTTFKKSSKKSMQSSSKKTSTKKTSTKKTKHQSCPPLAFTYFPRNLGRSLLGKKIHWLIDLGGSGKVRDLIGKKYCKNYRKIAWFQGKPYWNEKKGETPGRTLYFNGEDIGHWVYYNEYGIPFNSYELMHQKTGSNQFCQTFALIYMFAHESNNAYLKSLMNCLIPNDFAYNIRVVTQFWRFVINDPQLSTQLLIEIQAINSAFIARESRRERDLSIISDSSVLDLDMVNRLLNDIDLHADTIAKTT
tara:strand:+ start:1739 stop:2509 length:771 start_codon:yes stop_codon:yes gene_type:complete